MPTRDSAPTTAVLIERYFAKTDESLRGIVETLHELERKVDIAAARDEAIKRLESEQGSQRKELTELQLARATWMGAGGAAGKAGGWVLGIVGSVIGAIVVGIIFFVASRLAH